MRGSCRWVRRCGSRACSRAIWPADTQRPALPQATFDREVMTGRNSARSMVPLTIRTVRGRPVRIVRPADIRATIRNDPYADEGRADARTASRAAGSCPDFQPFPVLMLLRPHTCCADDSQNRYMWQIRDCRESDFRYMWHFPSRRCPHTFDFVPSNSSCPRRTATHSANRFCGTGQSATYSGNGVLD